MTDAPTVVPSSGPTKEEDTDNNSQLEDLSRYREVTGLDLSATQLRLVNNRRQRVRRALASPSSSSSSSSNTHRTRLLLTIAEYLEESIPATFVLSTVFVPDRAPLSWLWLGAYAVIHCLCFWLPTTLHRLATAHLLQILTLIACKALDTTIAWSSSSSKESTRPPVHDVTLRLFCRRQTDGVSFAYLHLEPKGRSFAAGKLGAPPDAFPTILIRTPYTRWCEAPVGYVLARRGYHVIIEDCRGRGDSEGRFEFLDQQADGASAIAWATEQPWFSPSKGLFLCGISFSGYCALAALQGVRATGDGKLRRRLLRHIRGIAPLYSSSDLPSIATRDGFRSWDILLRYCALLFYSGRYGGSQGLPQTLKGIWNIHFLGIFSDRQSASVAKAIRMGPKPASARVATQGSDIHVFNDMLDHTSVSTSQRLACMLSIVPRKRKLTFSSPRDDSFAAI